jgi:hypothetical protein
LLSTLGLPRCHAVLKREINVGLHDAMSGARGREALGISAGSAPKRAWSIAVACSWSILGG